MIDDGLSSLTVRPALYYPYIHIRQEHWLKATLLCAPIVKRIVPQEYTPEDTANILKYTKIIGPHGSLLQSVPSFSSAAYDAQNRLLEQLREHRSEIKHRFSRLKAPPKDRYWIHKEKFNKHLLGYLSREELAWPSVDPIAYGHRTWYALHPILGSAIMTTLGLSIAHEQKYDIVTPSSKFHEALLTTNEKDLFDVLISIETMEAPLTRQNVKRDLGQIVIELTGVNFEALQPEDIPELQSSKYFQKFQGLLRSIVHRIDLDTDVETYRQQLKSEAAEIIQAWHESKNDLSRGIKDVLFGEALPLEILKLLYKGVDERDILALAGWVGIRLLTSGTVLRKNAPYQYLTQIVKSQSNFIRMTLPLGLER